MELALKVAIAALIISFFSLIGLLINSVFTVKTYKKNRRLEFLQRRDLLSQKISELNGRNTEAQLISARYGLVAVKNVGLSLRGEQAERNTALIASIKVQQEGVERGIKLWDENIEKLHFIYINLTLETDASEVERMIVIVQVASDNLKKAYDGYSSVLHTLETANEIIKTNVAERDEKIRQINRETDEKIRQINLDFERAMEQLRKK
jgi:molybdopterin synthase catalytic subunit